MTTTAWADDGATPTPTVAPMLQAPPPAAESHDGFRMRHGVSATLGDEFGSGPSSGLSGVLGGVNWRIGAQINNNYAVYLETHLSFGTAHIGAANGVTADFAETVNVERTFADHFFAAVGGGYGVLNNPSGPVLELRGGWYPLISTSETRARRKGLMVGGDLRAYFADGATVGTVTQVDLSIGYEWF